jgi:hypothetical protein
MIFRILFYAFLVYLLYKLVFDFIIPVYKTSRQVKKGFREMHDRMQEHMQQQQQPQQSAKSKSETSNTKPGDYIEFEELK